MATTNRLPGRNQTWLTKWIAALESGKYRQGREFLTQVRAGQEYDCCLGVLCKIEGLDRYKTGNTYSYHVEGYYSQASPSYPPDHSIFYEMFPHTSNVEHLFSSLNDFIDFSFDEIATFLGLYLAIAQSDGVKIANQLLLRDNAFCE